LNKLDAVSEWVAYLEAGIAGDRDGIEGFDTMRFQLCLPCGHVGHLIGKMGFGCPAINAIFGADVYLSIPYLQPEATSSLQRLWLGYLW
jgi:hypothetical protein